MTEHMVVILSSLGASRNSFSFSLDREIEKKSLNMKTLHCSPLEPGSPLFCGNPSVHPSKVRQTHLCSLRNRAVLQNNKKPAILTCPCPCPCPKYSALYWWWTGQDRSLPLWKAEKAHFPHLHFRAAFLLLSSCQSQAHKYCRLSHMGAGKRRHMLQLPNAMQHASNRKDFIAKHQKFNCQAVSGPSTPTYTHTPG